MTLYHSQHLGKTEFYFWYGQVVGGGEWECNHQHTIHDRDEPKGWGYRCKVAIFGSDPRIVTDGVAKNSELAMAEVMIPTTGGGGIGGPISTPSIGNNSFVVGFYKDGVNAREPIIMGVLPNISQSRLPPYTTTDNNRYIAASGFDIKTDLVPTASIFANSPVFPFDENWNVHTFDVSDRDQYLDPRLETFRFPVSYRCTEEGGEMKGIQGFLQDAMKYISFINTQTSSFASAVSDLRNSVENIIDRVVSFISSLVKSIVTRIREYTLNLFEKTIQYVIDLTPISLRAQVVDGVKEQTDILSCLFSLIIGGIVNVIKEILTNLLEGAVNAPMCVAENVVGEYFTQILGQITEGIDGVISGISSIVGGVVQFSSQIFNALNIIFGVFNILTCQEQYACPNVEEWNFWYGQQETTDNVAEELGNLIEQLALNDTSSDGSCSTAPRVCGPPEIIASTSGNFIEEFLGNAIVSPSGEIIAVDIINSGLGYLTDPNLIVNSCGDNGSGAILRPILNESGGIDQIVILDSGTGYISSPNGSTSSGNLQFSAPEDSIIYSPNTGYSAYPPNTNVNVNEGDLMYLPSGTTGEIYDNEGNLIQSSLGLGPTEPIVILGTGILGTPLPPDTEEMVSEYPSSANNSYPIVLEIKDIFIRNPGINYEDGDSIVIEPSNGAELIPKFNNLGSLESVEVVNTGIGFTEMPNIYIDSEKGFNAIIIPIFGVKRVGDLTEEQDNQQISQESIIEVIDCVGFIPPKKEFDLVPR